MRRLLLACLLSVLCLIPTGAQDEPRAAARLAGLGKLWGAVKFFHPYIAYKTIDWDAALTAAIPRVKAARSPAEYRAAIGGMLDALGDPATTTESDEFDAGDTAAAIEEPTYFRTVEDHVVVNVLDWARTMVGGNAMGSAKQSQLPAEIAKAKGIVLDCRYGRVPWSAVSPFYVDRYINSSLPMLLQGTVPLGTERYRIHSGYPPQQGNTSGGYSSGFLSLTPGLIAGQAEGKKPLAVLIDERTPDLTAVLSGVQAAGGRIVRVGKRSKSGGARTQQIVLPDDVRVSLRVTEFVHPNGGSEFQPDVELTSDAGVGEAAILAAIKALKSPVSARPAAASASQALVGQSDNPYPSMSFPSEEYRLLALFRFWNVVNYFYPYKALTDTPWEMVLTDFIPRFLSNKNADDYETAIAEMVARMQDSHGNVRGFRALNERMGAFAPPVRLGSAGDQLVVVDVMDAAAAQAAGIARGDVILAVDGEPVAQRLAGLSKVRALSTPQAAYAFVYPSALRGARGSTVAVRVQGTGGPTREVTLTRSVPLGSVSGMLPRRTPIHQVLPSGYGYVDLARLPLADAHKALDAVLNTPAVIFDMRGYPNGTAWALAPRLTDKTNITAALFRRPLQVANELDGDLGGASGHYTFEQKIPPPQGTIYKGKVVMLINEFAISQSEHTCLFFESATNVTFVGTPTNGANGDVTNLVLPGNIYVNFTGHDVRHADGRQLQRVGIQPHVKVAPTAKGISEGRDEVLDAAIAHLKKTLKKD